MKGTLENYKRIAKDKSVDVLREAYPLLKETFILQTTFLEPMP